VLVFLHLGSRRVYLSQPTFHPDETWVMQQARNVTMWLDDHGISAKYLIHDRDTKFTRQWASAPSRSCPSGGFCWRWSRELKIAAVLF
jgi:putative transposase